MSQKDSATKVLLRKPEVFADAFNQYLYHGKQVIHPENLQEKDVEEIVLPFGSGRGKTMDESKLRDILKLCTVKTDGKLNYCILGIESQSDVHYAMPVRNLLYDAMNLSSQVSSKSKMHKKEKDLSSKEFLSGFRKEDKIFPVITLVFYFGEEPWDGPRSLREMYDEVDEVILSHAVDYKLNLISPGEMTEEELKEFHSELGQVATLIKYAGEKESLKKYVMNQTLFQNVSEEVIRVIELFTSYKFPRQEKEETTMWKGFEELCEEYREKGVIEGVEEGLEKGLVKGLEKGKLDTLISTLRNMLKLGFSDEQIIEVLELTPERLEEMKKEYVTVS